ncbi:MAG: polysaccharide biosynthesis/export family protein, partial [Planctomycetota bacterium]
MSTVCFTLRFPMLATLAASLAIGLSGCQVIDLGNPALEEPVPPSFQPAVEKSMVSLPAYRIEPPDVLQIEVFKLVPLPPYRAEVYDVLQIQVMGTLPEHPIGPLDAYGRPTPDGGFYLVEAEGTVNLGPAYGTVRVAGMTIEQMEEEIRGHLFQVLRNPVVSVKLARASGTQPITGPYLVGPDGTVNLRQYGSVHVAGKTVAEAKVALEGHLSRYFDSPEVSVDVAAYNSKVFYVVTEGAGLGDNIVRVPITGNETVLDAISQVGGLSQLSSKQIWIARPAPGDFGCEQILPIDWVAITRGGVTATNYQVMPGDRIFIAEDNMVALGNFINKVVSPFE